MNELSICPIHKIHILGKQCDQCSDDEELRLEESVENTKNIDDIELSDKEIEYMKSFKSKKDFLNSLPDKVRKEMGK